MTSSVRWPQPRDCASRAPTAIAGAVLRPERLEHVDRRRRIRPFPSPDSTMFYLLEPFGRNTAPAVAARRAACAVALRRRRDAARAAGRPSDPRPARVRRRGRRAPRRSRKKGRLVTFGIRPTHPETGFGYIECGDAMPGRATAAFARAVSSKNRRSRRARDYLAAGHYVWNSGMFCFTPTRSSRRSRATRRACSPRRAASRRRSPSAESPQMLEIDAALFAAVPDISIDYAIMERAAEAGEVAVVAARSTGATSARGRRSRR